MASCACADPVRAKLPDAPTNGTTYRVESRLESKPTSGNNSFAVPVPSLTDQMVELLKRVLEEQAQLRRLLEENQQAVLPRLDELTLSFSTFATQQQQATTKEEEELEHVHESLNRIEEKVDIPEKPAPEHNESAQLQPSHTLDEIRKQKAGHKPQSLIGKILFSTAFEIAIALVIFVNTGAMFVNLQLRGLHAGWKLDQRNEAVDLDMHESRFDLMEQIFNWIYLVELIMRLWVLRCRFFSSFSNIMDALIVLCSFLDIYLFQALKVDFVNVSVLRMIRLTRILRLGKVLRSSQFFAELRVLIRTLYIALRGVLWSVVLLSAIVIAGGIIMAQMIIQLLDDDSIDIDRRIWMYKYFGTTMSAIYTIFESSFTTSWINYSRPLIEEVGYVFAAFWIPWVVLVNFTTMRVVGALFLKSTMGVSARDAENVAMSQLKNKARSAEYLREIFIKADTSGDGAICATEFEEMMMNQDVLDAFAFMDLDTDEVTAFYTVLASDDGVADYSEFIAGALAMASSAPNLDRMKSMQNQMKIQELIRESLEISRKIAESMNLPC